MALKNDFITLHPILMNENNTPSKLTNSKAQKSRFPSIDGTDSIKSFSKLLMIEEDFGYSQGSTLRSNDSMKYFMRKGKKSIVEALQDELARSSKDQENSFGNTKVHFQTITDTSINKTPSVIKESANTKKFPKFRKPLKLQLGRIPFNNRQKNSTLQSVNNFSNSHTNRSKSIRVPEHVFENRMKILLAIQMKEPMLVLECKKNKSIIHKSL